MSEVKRSASRKSQPISRHPLFPAIVALWSGALFGLASLALHPAMLEHAVLALGIDRVIPMAAPPLGTTARILMTLGLTGLGAVIGALAALRIARPTHNSDARAAAAPAARARMAGRRRSRATGTDGSAADLRENAGVQARSSQILNVADFEVDSFDADDAGMVRHEARAETVEAEFVEIEADEASQHEAPLFLQSRPTKTTATGETDDGGASQVAASLLTADPEEQLDKDEPCKAESCPAAPFSASAVSAGHAAADRIASAALDELSPIELLERLALAMAQRRDEARLTATPATPAADHEAQAEAEPPMIESATRTDSVNLDAIVQTEPFAGEPGVHTSLVDSEPVQERTTPPELPRLPAALRPVDLAPIADGDEEDDDALPAYIPPRHIGLTPAAAIDEDAEAEEEQVLEQGYSSLTSLSRGSWGAPPDEEPADSREGPEAEQASARPFDGPGQSPVRTDPEATEKALRDALATLQRMSGAA